MQKNSGHGHAGRHDRRGPWTPARWRPCYPPRSRRVPHDARLRWRPGPVGRWGSGAGRSRVVARRRARASLFAAGEMQISGEPFRPALRRAELERLRPARSSHQTNTSFRSLKTPAAWTARCTTPCSGTCSLGDERPVLPIKDFGFGGAPRSRSYGSTRRCIRTWWGQPDHRRPLAGERAHHPGAHRSDVLPAKIVACVEQLLTNAGSAVAGATRRAIRN